MYVPLPKIKEASRHSKETKTVCAVEGLTMKEASLRKIENGMRYWRNMNTVSLPMKQEFTRHLRGMNVASLVMKQIFAPLEGNESSVTSKETKACVQLEEMKIASHPGNQSGREMKVALLHGNNSLCAIGGL